MRRPEENTLGGRYWVSFTETGSRAFTMYNVIVCAMSEIIIFDDVTILVSCGVDD